MAIRPNESETFLREVDEELRKERLNTFVARYGWWMVAGVVLLLAAIGGFIWWQHQQQELAGSQGEMLLEALDTLEGANASAAAPAVEELAASRIEGYRVAALFARASLQAEGGDEAAAIATLRSIAEDGRIDEAYRQAALVRQTALEFDRLQPQAVIGRLGPLARPGQAWFGTAGEMVGIAHLKMNRSDLAGPLFAQIGRDESVPASIRTRAIQMAGSLGINALPDQPEPDAEPQAPAGPAATREETE